MKNREVQRALDAGAAGYLLKSVRWELREPIAMHPGEAFTSMVNAERQGLRSCAEKTKN